MKKNKSRNKKLILLALISLIGLFIFMKNNSSSKESPTELSEELQHSPRFEWYNDSCYLHSLLQMLLNSKYIRNFLSNYNETDNRILNELKFVHIDKNRSSKILRSLLSEKNNIFKKEQQDPTSAFDYLLEYTNENFKDLFKIITTFTFLDGNITQEYFFNVKINTIKNVTVDGKYCKCNIINIKDIFSKLGEAHSNKTNFKNFEINSIPPVIIMNNFLQDQIEIENSVPLEIKTTLKINGDIYKLKATVNRYRGSSINSGHFTAKINKNNIWYEIDDLKNSILNRTDNYKDGAIDYNVYMLLYEKENNINMNFGRKRISIKSRRLFKKSRH